MCVAQYFGNSRNGNDDPFAGPFQVKVRPVCVRRTPARTGLHKITVSDGDDMTRVTWKQGTPMTIISSLDEPAAFSGSWNLYFYVPKKTKIVGLFADGSGTLLDPTGNVAFAFKAKKPDYYRINVPKGRDGKLWKFHQCTGIRRLMTVPPCLALNAKELLLPKEVVEADCN